MPDNVIPLRVPVASRIEWWVCEDPKCRALHIGLKSEDNRWIATNTVSKSSLIKMLAFLETEKPER